MVVGSPSPGSPDCLEAGGRRKGGSCVQKKNKSKKKNEISCWLAGRRAAVWSLHPRPGAAAASIRWPRRSQDKEKSHHHPPFPPPPLPPACLPACLPSWGMSGHLDDRAPAREAAPLFWGKEGGGAGNEASPREPSSFSITPSRGGGTRWFSSALKMGVGGV